LHIQSLNETEKKALEMLLDKVARKSITSIGAPNASSQRYAKPDMIQEAFQKEQSHNSSNQLQTVKFINLPYFALEKYSTLSMPTKSNLHPCRTILQSRFQSTTKERDMRQAVCTLSSTPTGFCFHTAQLWCVVYQSKCVIS
jgi:hypothetical protein